MPLLYLYLFHFYYYYFYCDLIIYYLLQCYYNITPSS